MTYDEVLVVKVAVLLWVWHEDSEVFGQRNQRAECKRKV